MEEMDAIKKRRKAIRDLNEKYQALLVVKEGITEESIDREWQECDKYEEEKFDVQQKFSVLRNPDKEETIPIASEDTVINVKLPELALKSYDGSLEGKENLKENAPEPIASLSSQACTGQVLLMTTVALLRGPNASRRVRILLDSGSQFSYIKQSLVWSIGIERKGEITIAKSLFGGNKIGEEKHGKFMLELENLGNKRDVIHIEALDQRKICDAIPPLPKGDWLEKLKIKGIILSQDNFKGQEIDILIGANYLGMILTGKIVQVEADLTAVETKLGWTLMGNSPIIDSNDNVQQTLNLLTARCDLKDLWDLEVLGIRDPVETCSKETRYQEIKEKFITKIQRQSDQRYSSPTGQRFPSHHDNKRMLRKIGTCPKEIRSDDYRGWKHTSAAFFIDKDSDYQRILWRPSPEEPVVDYRLLTVTYGTTSAPFLAMRTLQQLAEDEGQNYPEASRVTLNDFYVDDLLTGAQTIAETKELIDQLKDLMKKGGFHLRKWNSNCHEIVSHVEEINEERKINLEKGAISKILGIVWDYVQDTFRVNITLPEEVVTKRDLLSNITRIFDPIGFLSPTTVAMANLQRQTAVKEVEDLEGLPVYHRAILKENGEWPEVTKAIQCSYPKVFVGDGTHLYLLIEDVESLDGPNVRSDWVRAVFVHAGKESKYLWKLNLKSKQWTELPTYVKYRDSQYTAVALDLVFILGPADKEHETAEKYLSFFKTRRPVEPEEPQETTILRNPLGPLNGVIEDNVGGLGIRRSTRVKKPTGCWKIVGGYDQTREPTKLLLFRGNGEVSVQKAGDDTYASKVQKAGDDTYASKVQKAGDDTYAFKVQKAGDDTYAFKVQKGGNDTGPAQGSWSPLQRGPAEDLQTMYICAYLI
ncbi:hypothetical protein LAZ67_4003776 [Cordylochernes scorpioides]|uniref:Peptidase aspartic putative domain-containing protein n=1 Tax=Cordylochernes scorpioides TaxID=51811 RepID=A0ABY6KEZ1_9ARAC|nr:hypothetical protein LAZ67_4003776 [Cordylochernes scorpioides]